MHLEHKYLGFTEGSISFANKNNKFVRVKSDILVGADGPLSDVAKSNRLFGKRDFYIGIQARVKGNFDPDIYEVYLGSICPDFFAWVVPESKTIARIGVGAKRYSSKLFLRFLGIKGIKSKDILDKQAGLIPIYNKNICVNHKNWFFVGDAAAQIKATTGGGLVPGLKAAEILADCILNNKNYRKELSSINKELSNHLRIRKVLDRFSDKDYNKLLKMLNNKKIKSILKQSNRDLSSKLVVNLLFSEPRFLRYLTKIV